MMNKLDVGLSDIITSYLEELPAEQLSRHPFRPSRTGDCSMLLYQDYIRYQQGILPDYYKHTGDEKKIFKMGHAVEAHLIDLLKPALEAYGMELGNEQAEISFPDNLLDDGFQIKGNIDFTVRFGDLMMVCDSKSSKDGFSASHMSRWETYIDNLNRSELVEVISDNCVYIDDLAAFVDQLGVDFKVSNFTQVNFYLFTNEFKHLEYGSLLYYIKNSSRIFEIRFKKSMSLFEKTVRKFNYVIKASKDKKLDMDTLRDFYLGSIRCAFCPIKNMCRPEQDAKESWLKLLNKYKKDDSPVIILDKIKPKEIKKKILDIYNKYDIISGVENQKTNLEQELIKYLLDEDIVKFKCSDESKDTFEIKQLKTPKLHYELRRVKTYGGN